LNVNVIKCFIFVFVSGYFTKGMAKMIHEKSSVDLMGLINNRCCGEICFFYVQICVENFENPLLH